MTAKADADRCKRGGYIFSICPDPGKAKIRHYPYDEGKPITLVGYQIVQILSKPTAGGYMVVGSYNGGKFDAADVFAMTGGVGTNSKAGNFPSGTGIPQGERKGYPRHSHIDVYGVCDDGMQQALINILYVSP